MPESPFSDGHSSGIGNLWEVQDILAQRVTLSGEIEYLVVWRSTWSAADLVKDGPVLRNCVARNCEIQDFRYDGYNAACSAWHFTLLGLPAYSPSAGPGSAGYCH